MDKMKIDELIQRVERGNANADDLGYLERLIESGRVDLAQLEELNVLKDRLMRLTFPEPSIGLDERFYRMMEEATPRRKSFSWSSALNWNGLVPRLALGSLLVVASFLAGYFLRPADTGDMAALREEMRSMKEMMVLSMLEKESPTERLKAVSLGTDLDQASSRVTEALIQTLNHDENVNVRLAALDALKAYALDSSVRKALIESIAMQESPLVQLALADLMAQLQAKSSVKALEQIVESEKTPEDVKRRIRKTIEVLI